MPSRDLTAGVQKLLDRQIAEGRQTGTQVAAYLDGAPLLDLCAGVMGASDLRPVQPDSLFSSFSTTKGVATTAVHILADGGLLEYEQPVARYWPEFAANGKEAITVEQAMSHQAGLHRAPDGVDLAFLADWDGAIRWMAQVTPAFPPGSATAYCAMTFAWVAGGIVQGATGGRHIRDVIREEIAEPLGIADEMFVGIPDGVEERLTTLTALPRPADAPAAAAAGAAGERGRIGPATPFDFNDMAMRKVCLPSGNGHFSARALARMYGALANAGELDAVRLVSAERIPAMWRPATDAYDEVLLRRLRKGIGFILGGPIDGTVGPQGPRTTAFGHPGAGGSIAFADPEIGLSIAVTLNQLQPRSMLGEGVAAEICDFIRAALGTEKTPRNPENG